jgi:hypothetical protein
MSLGLRAGKGAAFAIVLALIVPACAADKNVSGETGGSARPSSPATSLDAGGRLGPLTGTPASAEQLAALADDKITYDEYVAAYRRYASCVAAGGYQIVEQGQTNQVFHYAVPAAAVDSGVNDTCYDKEFYFVDSQWQVSVEDTSDEARRYAECLNAKGITPAEHAKDRYQQLLDAGIDPQACLSSQ